MSQSYRVVFYPGEDGYWVIECPGLPGCISQRRTEEEALENIEDAIQACLQVRKELGLPLSLREG